MAKIVATKPGDKFERWTVRKARKPTKRGCKVWSCRCECGLKRDVLQASLRNGSSKSCGCLNLEMLAARTKHGASNTDAYKAHQHVLQAHAAGHKVSSKWMTMEGFKPWFDKEMGDRPEGMIFCRINPKKPYKPGNLQWVTRKQARQQCQWLERVLYKGKLLTFTELALRVGIKRSRLHRRIVADGLSVKEAVAMGPGKTQRNHGMKWHSLYGTYSNMLTRCLNPKFPSYEDYGGRGISIHEPWIGYPDHFIKWVLRNLGKKPTPKHTLDRIDVNGNYEPGNLRWATPTEQNDNKRESIILTYKGKKVRIVDLARRFDIAYKVLNDRIFILGWKLKKALTTPV